MLNIDQLTHEQAIELLKEIQKELIGCEDGNDFASFVSDLLEVDIRT